MIRKMPIILIFILFTMQSFSQDFVKGLNKVQLKSYAENSERTGDFLSAIYYYEKYLNKNPKDYEVCYKLAECYKSIKNYEKAEVFYKRCTKKSIEKYSLALFYMAQMQKRNGKYYEAINNFIKFKKIYKTNKNWVKFKKTYKTELAGCYLATSLKDSVKNVIITRLDTAINKYQADFAPFIIDENTLLFSSLRAEKNVSYEPEVDLTHPVKKIYKAKKINKQWVFDGVFENFNDVNFNTANGVLSADGKSFFFTKCRKNWKYITICSIYKSVKINGKWQNAEKLAYGINGDNFSSTQPTTGID